FLQVLKYGLAQPTGPPQLAHRSLRFEVMPQYSKPPMATSVVEQQGAIKPRQHRSQSAVERLRLFRGWLQSCHTSPTRGFGLIRGLRRCLERWHAHSPQEDLRGIIPYRPLENLLRVPRACCIHDFTQGERV